MTPTTTTSLFSLPPASAPSNLPCCQMLVSASQSSASFLRSARSRFQPRRLPRTRLARLQSPNPPTRRAADNSKRADAVPCDVGGFCPDVGRSMRSVRVLGKSFDAPARRADRLTRSRSWGAQRAASLAMNSLALGLAAVLLLLVPAVSLAGTFTVFGETYQRGTGAPVTVTRSFSALNLSTTYTLRIDNGGLPSGQFCRVSSAVVGLNGVEVVGPSDFNRRELETEREREGEKEREDEDRSVAVIERRVSLATTNVLTVELRDGPGSGVTLWIIGVDNGLPLSTAAASPPVNAAGWNNTDVRVTFTCADAMSAIARCSDPVTVTTEGAGQVVSGTAVDIAGNQSSATLTVNIDKGRPVVSAVVSPPANAAGWNNTDVRVSFTCTDATSGIARCPDPVTLNTEGAGQVVSGTAVDIAGNQSSVSVALNIDKTSPAASAVLSPPANAAGWNNTDVRVSFTCGDATSKIARCPDAVTVTAEGAGQVVSGTAVDVAGNQSTASVTLNIDKTPPVVDVAVSPAANGAGWNNGNATVTFTCTDATSGVARCPAPVTVTTEGAGQVISGAAVDVAGNQATRSITLNIDKTPPAVQISAPAEGSTIRSRQVQVSGSVTEANALSAITVQGAQVPRRGNAFSTQLLLDEGTQTITVEALDVAGNRGSANVRFAVVLNRAPTASPGGPYGGDTGQAISFNGASSTDPDNDSLSFAWDFGDGTTGTGATPSHSYRTPGSFTVALTVSDGRGGTNTASTTATIVDRTAPVVSLNGPREALPGVQVTMIAQATDNAAVESVTFEVNGADPSRVTSPPYERVISIPIVASVGATIRVTATARDTSGNTATAEASVTITALPDAENPVITLNAPPQAAPGTTVHLSAAATDNVGVKSVAFAVDGVEIVRVTTPPYEATYHIVTDVPIGASFLLSARAMDFSDNTSEATKTLTIVQAPDTTPPTVTLAAPQRVVAGGTLHLTATASDNVGVATVALLIDGAQVAAFAQAPYETDFQVAPDTPPGTALHVEARATDFAELTASDAADVRVVAAPPPGGGVVASVVYDDATGLPIEGATGQLISLDGAAPGPTLPQAATDTRGRFRLSSRPGSARIRIYKSGFTASYRLVTVVDGKRTDPFDARLTPLDTRDNQISSVTGGTASSQAGDASLGVPAGALASDQSLRLTSVTSQGLAARLPLGWSPVASLDISPRGAAFGTPAALSLRAPSDLASGMTLTLARWDPAAGAWIVEGQTSRTPDDTTLTTSVPQTGQYVLLLPDAAPNAPPAPIVGQGVPAVLANPPPTSVSAFITPSPKILFAQPGARSHVGVLVVPPSRMPSGSSFHLDLAETFNFVSGARLFPDPSGQDLALYSFGAGAPLTLISDFNVSPSHAFTLSALQGGVIDLAVSMPLDRGAARGTVIGPAGGTAATADAQLVIPGGAVLENLPVLLSSLTPAHFPAPIPPGLPFLAGVQVDLPGATLGIPATPSIPTPGGLAPDAQVLVVQLRE